MDELLVVAVDRLEVIPVAVDVQADVGDDDALVVGVAGCALDVDAHRAPDELDVGAQRPERAEDRGDRQLRMVKALAEHLHLHDRVQGAVAQLAQDLLLLLAALAAVDLARLEPAFLVEAADLPCVIHRARDGDQLVLQPTLSQLAQPLDRWSTMEMLLSSASATPREYQSSSRISSTSSRVCECSVPRPGEVELARRDVARRHLLDVAALHRRRGTCSGRSSRPRSAARSARNGVAVRLSTRALGKRSKTFCQLGAALWWPSSTRIRSKKSGGKFASQRPLRSVSCWMFVTTMCAPSRRERSRRR